MIAILIVVFIWLMLLWAINKSWKNYAEIVLKQQQFLNGGALRHQAKRTGVRFALVLAKWYAICGAKNERNKDG